MTDLVNITKDREWVRAIVTEGLDLLQRDMRIVKTDITVLEQDVESLMAQADKAEAMEIKDLFQRMLKQCEKLDGLFEIQQNKLKKIMEEE